jgi:hypothetical protein
VKAAGDFYAFFAELFAFKQAVAQHADGCTGELFHIANRNERLRQIM